jgi:hypothetical protein
METIFVVLGILVFLGVGYVFLMILVTPYIWFSAYIENEEEKGKQSRASFNRMLKEKEHASSSEIELILKYKPKPKGVFGKLINSHVVSTSTEWLFTWGLFLAIEALLAWNLYKGFELVTDRAFTFLEGVFGI